ncbi:MAG: dihydropteroate synthase [Alphaproteobacteria bacterium]
MNHATQPITGQLFDRLVQVHKKLSPPLIMGIVNLTPDSFSGDNIDPVASAQAAERAVLYAKAQAQAGAAILDLGAQSTRPGSSPVSATEERARLYPIVTHIKNIMPDQWLSIDTMKPEIAQEMLEQGAHIINDVMGGRDADMLSLAKQQRCPIILMHNQAQDGDVVEYQKGITGFGGKAQHNFMDRLVKELEFIALRALDAGLDKTQIILDPGIGFGKTIAQNLDVIQQLDLIKQLGYPVLIGASRKSFIGAITDHEQPADRVFGTMAIHYQAALNGADMLRVHDVTAHQDAMKIYHEFMKSTYMALGKTA